MCVCIGRSVGLSVSAWVCRADLQQRRFERLPVTQRQRLQRARATVDADEVLLSHDRAPASDIPNKHQQLVQRSDRTTRTNCWTRRTGNLEAAVVTHVTSLWNQAAGTVDGFPVVTPSSPRVTQVTWEPAATPTAVTTSSRTTRYV